jgi:hypothetical protein
MKRWAGHDGRSLAVLEHAEPPIGVEIIDGQIVEAYTVGGYWSCNTGSMTGILDLVGRDTQRVS